MTIVEQDGRILTRSRYLSGNYAPVKSEIVAHELPVIGELPSDLDGIFLRTGSNPFFEPRGRYHWFDGDGMIHAVHFQNGSATYRNRWIQTTALAGEMDAGSAQWTGVLERPDYSKARGPYKQTANTTMTWHAGKLLCSWWLSGQVFTVRLPDLETVGVEDFGGTYDGDMCAHQKVCPETGELIFIDYKPQPPYLTYGVMHADGTLRHLEPITLDGPRLQHDVCFTPRWSLLFDFSFMWDPEKLAQGRVELGFFRDTPTRIGLIPRYGRDADVRWFEVEPCFMYHVINAWEEADEVVLIGCRIADPLVGDPGNAQRPAPSIANLRLEPVLYEWRFNTTTGSVRERVLGDALTEFPTMDDRRLGLRTSIDFLPKIADRPTLLFDGIMRADRAADTLQTHTYADGWFGGEVAFCPRTGSTREDDGYLVTFVAQETTGTSECQIFDAARVGDGPIARLPIPQRVPTGYHTEWVSAADLATQQV